MLTMCPSPIDASPILELGGLEICDPCHRNVGRVPEVTRAYEDRHGRYDDPTDLLGSMATVLQQRGVGDF